MQRRIGLGWMAAPLVVALAWAGGAQAQQIFAYPQRGQSAEQQKRDEFECHQWAVQQSGVDPTAARTAQASPPSQGARGGPSVGRGATRGAAVGAVGGAIAGEAGKGAAIGAATGALFGGMRKADAQAQQQEQQQQVAAQGSSAYTRAMGACLQGRGYTVQ